MMMQLSFDVIRALGDKSLATAESCTGGMIGAALTSVPGSSQVYRGGIISYTNEVKRDILGVSADLLSQKGAVSAEVAEAMALGAMKAIGSDMAVSVTGLAGPAGDDFGNPVGTVYIGFADGQGAFAKQFLFFGDRQSVRQQAAKAALSLILENYNR